MMETHEKLNMINVFFHWKIQLKIYINKKNLHFIVKNLVEPMKKKIKKKLVNCFERNFQTQFFYIFSVVK